MLNSEFLFWETVWLGDVPAHFPSGICTRQNTAAASDLPPEVALLLPGPQSGPSRLDLDQISPEIAVAEFYGNPILNVSKLTRDLQAAHTKWVANLPSFAQHDAEFRRNLADVGLSYARELNALRQVKNAGLSLLVAVSTTEDARLAIEIGADALLVLPPVDAYESGFPSTQQRSRQIEDLRSAYHIDVPIFGLLTEAEHRFQSTWPSGLDGGVIRPRPLA